MSTIEALFYDGKSARPETVYLSVGDTGALVVTHTHRSAHYKAEQLQVSARVGNIPRQLAIPQGGQYEVEDNDWVDAWLADKKLQKGASLAYTLESKFSYAALALIITAAFTWVFFTQGLPVLSKHIAYNIPTETDQMLGSHALESLDDWIFEPSDLEEDRQAQLRQGFEQMLAQIQHSHPYNLQFRASPEIGANAFALPSGTIVMTDELVALAEDDRELYAILAHEIGHVQHRHSLRTVLQSSAVFIIVSLVAGDIGSSAGFLAALPPILIESKYSRDFETEADKFAFDYLKQHGLETQHFANIMNRLSAGSEAAEARFQYISSHPQTKERTVAFEQGEWKNIEP